MEQGKPTAKKPTTFRLEETLISKLKYIAWHSRKNNTDIYNEAIEDYIKKHEKKNGEITEADLKEARII